MERVLLHICCGVCASSVIERLKADGYEPVGFFYNPNIHPAEEYYRREEVVREVARVLKFELIPSVYDKDLWFLNTKGFEAEPEGGRRCSTCFRLRLSQTAHKARQLGILKFTTTLTVSPHKDARLINDIGRDISAENFLSYDFKKRDGFKLAIKFARQYNLYQQNYCGCLYSRRQ